MRLPLHKLTLQSTCHDPPNAQTLHRTPSAAQQKTGISKLHSGPRLRSRGYRWREARKNVLNALLCLPSHVCDLRSILSERRNHRPHLRLGRPAVRESMHGKPIDYSKNSGRFILSQDS
jgi:hypothetical protein